MSRANLEDGFGMESVSLGRYYGIVAVSTTIGICVVILLNLSTPLDLFPGKLVKMALSDTVSSGSAPYGIFVKRLLVVFFYPTVWSYCHFACCFAPLTVTCRKSAPGNSQLRIFWKGLGGGYSIFRTCLFRSMSDSGFLFRLSFFSQPTCPANWICAPV